MGIYEEELMEGIRQDLKKSGRIYEILGARVFEDLDLLETELGGLGLMDREDSLYGPAELEPKNFGLDSSFTRLDLEGYVVLDLKDQGPVSLKFEARLLRSETDYSLLAMDYDYESYCQAEDRQRLVRNLKNSSFRIQLVEDLFYEILDTQVYDGIMDYFWDRQEEVYRALEDQKLVDPLISDLEGLEELYIDILSVDFETEDLAFILRGDLVLDMGNSFSRHLDFRMELVRKKLGYEIIGVKF